MISSLSALHADMRLCRACPRVQPPVILGRPVSSPIYLLGQAPGPREGALGRPFGWTAGRTLFSWFRTLGVDEETFRSRVYIAAVLRCFPGKPAGNTQGRVGGSVAGDRVPDREEIATCAGWIRQELSLLRPRLVIAVGRLAIEQVAGERIGPLEGVVGGVRRGVFHGSPVDWVALPHPSGLSAWPKVEPGRTLLARALAVLGAHEAWTTTFGGEISAA